MLADHSTLASSCKWLEADGLGGFASGTATGIRTRRYHALLLYDVIDVNHQPGAVDASFRPNQIFAVGGLPLRLIEGNRPVLIVEAVKDHLWTPLGLRSLAAGEPGYAPRWVWVHQRTPAAIHEARREFLRPLIDHLEHSGLGHVSEIADAEAPHAPRGCPWQAWSVGEALWLDRVVLAQPPPRSTRNVRRNQRSPKLAEKPRRSMPSRDLVSA